VSNASFRLSALFICTGLAMSLCALPSMVRAEDSLRQSIFIAAAGMRVQGERMKVITQNIANADSTSTEPGGDPYRRKAIFFSKRYDKKLETELVSVKAISGDPTPFNVRYAPQHPAADENGFVKTPNVDRTLEMTDAREANQSYEANLNALDIARGMQRSTLELLR
jgi:flagellar basal-body rod protein FlgC